MAKSYDPVDVAVGATVTITGASAASVTFEGSTGTLTLDDGLDFTGDISGLAGQDAIDLADLAFNSSSAVSFLGTPTGGVLIVTNGTQTEKIDLSGSYLSSTWTLSSDGHGGTRVVDPVVNTNWQTLKVGAGGFVDGVDVTPDGTLVGRTDTNGAYLWNGTTWQQLVTSSSLPAAFVAANPVTSGNGVYEIQVAPSDSNVMYMMFDGDVFVTDNKGATWTQTSFATVTADPNGPQRYFGQKMAIDPANPNVVYVGTPQNGMFVSTNGGQTWSQVGAVPVSGTDSGAYPGITGILFDPAIGGTVNGVTQTIFASSYGNGVYESTDGGADWSKLNGGPSEVDYAAVSSNGAYYAIGNNNSELWRYANGAWTSVLTDTHWGIESFAINPNNPNEIVTASSNGSLNVSYDGGATWSGVDLSISLNSADIPWLAQGNTNPAMAGSYYLCTGGLAFSTTSPNELIITAGTGVWNVQIPTSGMTSTTPLTYNDMSAGIENLVANEVLVPPGGNPVLASWDRPFTYVANPDQYATTYGPVNSFNIVAGWSVDYASSTPSFLVGIADWWGTEESGYSTNGGQTWTHFPTEIPEAGSSFIGGSIAASTTTNFIWAPADGNDPYYTLDGGQTWNPITLPGVTSWSGFDWGYYLNGRTVTADRVLPNTFYLYYNGVYETTDGGKTWNEVYNQQLSQYPYNSEIMSVPGQAGNLFFTSGLQGNGTNPPSWAGFYMSTDQGKTWNALPNVLEVTTFGFGAAAPGRSYPSIYIVGYVNQVFGVWQSTDKGQSWTQIGTQPTGELQKITTISGDPNVFGKVYVGFGGGGYAYLNATSTAATDPTVASVAAAPASGVEYPGNTITFTVTMSEAVTIAGGKPTLTLNDGGVATYASGSGSGTLTFVYTVSNTDSDVSQLAITGSNLNGATATAAGGGAADFAGVVATFANISVDPPGNGLNGGSYTGSNSTLTVNAGVTEAITGSGDTIDVSGVGANVTVGGNGAFGASDLVNGNDDALNLQANSRFDVTGNNDSISSGTASNFGVTGNNDVITAGARDGIWLHGGTGEQINGSSDSIYVVGTSSGTISGSGDTILLKASGDTFTVGGNGSFGADNLVFGSGATLILEANSRLDVYGANNNITSAANSNFGVSGNDDVISAAANDGVWLHRGTGEQFQGSNDLLYFSSSVSAAVSGSSDKLYVAAGDSLSLSGATNSELLVGSASGATITGYANASNDVIDLTGGAGGYSSTAAVLSALKSDGAGGSTLALGSSTLHIANIAPSALVAADFKIG